MEPHKLVAKLVQAAGGEGPVARAMGSPGFQGTLWKFTHGETASPSRQTAERIATHFGMPVDVIYDADAAARWIDDQQQSGNALLTGANPVHVARESSPPSWDSRPREDHRLSHTMVTIPQFATGGAMGSGVLLRDQPGVIQAWRVDRDWLTRNVKGFTSVNNLTIVTGFGDSMRPMFNPGDPLLVDIGVKTVDHDGVYFFRVGDEGYIKRLQRIPGEGLRVLSANRDIYEPWTIRSDMQFEVMGRVLKVWRSEDV